MSDSPFEQDPPHNLGETAPENRPPVQRSDSSPTFEVSEAELVPTEPQPPVSPAPPQHSFASNPQGADDTAANGPVVPASAQVGMAQPVPVQPTPTQRSNQPVAASGVSSSMDPIKKLFDNLTAEIGKIYIGQEELVRGTLVALFSGGHVLIESVPGLGKTLFVRTLGRVLGCKFGRIQFTADLMPSDITGAPIFNMKTSDFEFRPGPVFTQLLLCDEINRSPAKTHAALLEIMQEYHVTVERTTHRLQRPFLVLATQNPIESEGTYNLPEAQLDRFMFKLVADYPTVEEEARVLKEHSSQIDLDQMLEDQLRTLTTPEKVMRATQLCSQVRVDDRLVDYINQIVRMTRKWPQFYMGASPRAGLAFVKAARTLAAFRGRDYAVPDDVIEIALPILRHRVTLTAEAEVEGQQIDELLTALIGTVEVPRM